MITIITIITLMTGTACTSIVEYAHVVTDPRLPSTGPEAPPSASTTTPDMVLIPAGAFTRGSATEELDARAMRQVYLDDFWIDKVEVTAVDFWRCIESGKCDATPSADDDGEDEEEFNCSTASDKNLPASCVTWEQARQYCASLGFRLPTEAEWEKAARGTTGSVYPWGSTHPTCSRAIYYDGGAGCGRDSPWSVGSKPAGASPYGVLDMAGNVAEWVEDAYDSSFYARAPNENPLWADSTATDGVTRGGSFDSDKTRLKTTHRDRQSRTVVDPRIGFRCAKSIE